MRARKSPVWDVNLEAVQLLLTAQRTDNRLQSFSHLPPAMGPQKLCCVVSVSRDFRDVSSLLPVKSNPLSFCEEFHHRAWADLL